MLMRNIKKLEKDGTINSIIAQRVIDKAAVAGNGNQCSYVKDCQVTENHRKSQSCEENGSKVR